MKELVPIFQVREDHAIHRSCRAIDCVLILGHIDAVDDGCLSRPRSPQWQPDSGFSLFFISFLLLGDSFIFFFLLFFCVAAERHFGIWC